MRGGADPSDVGVGVYSLPHFPTPHQKIYKKLLHSLACGPKYHTQLDILIYWVKYAS